jgi:hypothetical protein
MPVMNSKQRRQYRRHNQQMNRTEADIYLAMRISTQVTGVVTKSMRRAGPRLAGLKSQKGAE